MTFANKIAECGITIFIIEHNLCLIGQADLIINIGLNIGKEGGKILFVSKRSQLVKEKTALMVVAIKNYYQI